MRGAGGRGAVLESRMSFLLLERRKMEERAVIQARYPTDHRPRLDEFDVEAVDFRHQERRLVMIQPPDQV